MTYSPTNDGAIVAHLETLADVAPREWQSGEWEKTGHNGGPGWSRRADDLASAGDTSAPYVRGDGYPLDLPGGQRLYIVPNHDSAAHIGNPSGYPMEWEHRGRMYHAHPSLHVYRVPCPSCDGRGEPCEDCTADPGYTWADYRTAENVDEERRNGYYPDADGRIPSKLYGADDMPAGAQEKLRAAILAAFREWAEATPEAFKRARAMALNNAARSREEKVRNQAAELLDVLAELRRIDNDDADAPTY